MLYFKMEDYKASIQIFKNLVKDYPDSKHREEILYYALRSHYKYASKSIAVKRKERFAATVEAFDDLAASFPNSVYMKDARSMQKTAQKEINN